MAQTPISNDASQGVVTARDPDSLREGECQVLRSTEYRIGSPHAYKLPGRSSTGATLGGDVLAVTKLQYDSGEDVLVADAAGNIKESDVSTAPTFSTTPVTGLSETAVPQYTGLTNSWVRCNGADDNLIREAGPVVGPPVVGTGTVSGAAGQAVVTGTGTTFTTQLGVGSKITFSTGELVTVLTVDSATQITLATNLFEALSAATFVYATPSQGNWRTVGLVTALVPELSSISRDTSGGQILRPTHYANQSHLPNQGWAAYHDPALAFDTVGTGTGTVSGAAGQQVLTGSGTFFTTELSVGAILAFPNGEQAVVQSIAAATQLTLTVNLNAALSASAFTFTNTTTSTDPLETRAWGNTGDCTHQLDDPIGNGYTIITPRRARCTWIFSSNLTGSNRVLSARHNGAVSPPDQAPSFGPTGMSFALEYSLDSGSTWSPLGQVRNQPFTDIREETTRIPDAANSAALRVRSTISADPGANQRISGHWLDITHAVYDIKLTTGATTVYNAANPITYGISEVYVDSNGVEHQSNMGTQVGIGSNLAGLVIQAADLQAATAVTLNLPRPINPLATHFIIWRSVDTPGGGFPVMYEIGRRPITDTQFVDTFTIRPDDTAGIARLPQYKILEILYSDGTSTFTNYYNQPPLSFMTLVFQGCLVYFPSAIEHARRIFYSLPATISNSAFEQVPDQYFLDHQTPRNDQVRSGAVTNGGRSLLTFFENYTMLVNFLPQGADPGGFNNTVKEHVSNVRGCAGAQACTEFTLSTGQTLVAAVDGLGLWVTNGVNLVEEWSSDLDWPALIEGVTLSNVILVDKPHKRRIEMLYTDAAGDRQEMHFFYGRLKPGIDGKQGPLVTGPHPSGCRCKYYTMIDGQWIGFGGDASEIGDVFLEDDQAADDSNGYNASGVVPWTITPGDLYIGGETKSHLVERADVKFSDGIDKDFQVVATFFRDTGKTHTVTKTYSTTGTTKVYLHQYCDRHRMSFTDLTNTEAPAFVGYSLITRPAGDSRDR